MSETLPRKPLLDVLAIYFANGTDWVKLTAEDHAELVRDQAAALAEAAAEIERLRAIEKLHNESCSAHWDGPPAGFGDSR